MLRHTGPGKIRELLIDPQDSANTILAVLYNFDIDGDLLKPQHKDWLKAHVIPQLGNPSVKISLRGEASRSGSDAYNLALSQRRINQVLSLLQANGPVRASITSTAVGEADASGRGEEDKTEDEFVRAVVVKVEQSDHRFVPVLFSGVHNQISDGFDPGADPPWVMIPAESPSLLMQVENGEGLTLVSSKAAVAFPQPALFPLTGPVKVTRQTQIFRIVGGVPGDAEIRAVDAKGKIHGRLAVSVLPALTVKCAFHYVQNPRYGTRTRHRGDEAGILDGLNSVWTSQANIKFVQIPGNTGDKLDLKMTDNLGEVIDTDAKFDAVAKHRDPKAQFNIFFVREVGPDTDNTDVKAETGAGDCLCEDDTGPAGDAIVVAHEAGHALTLDHNDPIVTTSVMLMFFEATRRFLPRAHVLQARRAVRR